ncbi:MAG: hypothetical protein M3443_20225, partial [Actinomycetota bacterium]|nr:hypothetical protein [Actinomycetota bacterium]
MSEPTSDPNDAHAHLAHELHEAAAMPAGMAKCEALERVVRSADGARAPDLAVPARLMLINAYRGTRRYDLMLTPFAWLRGAEQNSPESFDEWALHQFNWMHKWLPTGLLGDPRFTLAQIASVVEELGARYQRQGYSLHPVHDKRRALAQHVGDTGGVDEHFAAFRAAEPDTMSDCPACVVDSQVSHLVSRDKHEEAITLAQQMLTQPSNCAEQPHGVMSSLLDAYLATGRTEDAARAHLASFRVIRGTPEGRSALHTHIVFCAVTGNTERGVEILTDHLDVLTTPPSPKILMDFAAATALLLDRVPGRGELSFDLDGRTMSGEELRAHCVEVATDTARAFDARNGTESISSEVSATLARVDSAPVLLATPKVISPEPEPLPREPSDPVDLAERACTAMDDGALFTGARLLASLPADFDVLLPEGLAARVAVHRVWLSHGSGPEDLTDRLRAVLDRLVAVGEDAAAARLHAFLAELLASTDRAEEAARHVESALAVARRIGDPLATIRAHLAAAELVGASDPAAAMSAVDAAERIAVDSAPDRIGGVRKARAELIERSGDREGALALIDELDAERDRWT